MKKKSLLTWGGGCAFGSVILFVIVMVTSKVVGGITWTAFIPLFSIIICLWVIVLLAGYDYLAKTHYTLARIGYAFGLLLIVVLFAEVAALGADRMIVRSGSATSGDELSPMYALFNSTHVLAIWFHGLWMAFWGAGFIRLPGKAKVSGALMLVFAAFYSVYYLLLRLGETAYAELAHSSGHVALVISLWLLGMLLIEAGKVPD